jgi:hypothetical protein
MCDYRESDFPKSLILLKFKNTWEKLDLNILNYQLSKEYLCYLAKPLTYNLK